MVILPGLRHPTDARGAGRFEADQRDRRSVGRGLLELDLQRVVTSEDEGVEFAEQMPSLGADGAAADDQHDELAHFAGELGGEVAGALLPPRAV